MWNVFRTCGRDDQQTEVAGAYILSKFRDKKVGIVHDKTTYGQGLADGGTRVITSGGMREVLYEGINLGNRDFTALATKIKAAAADLVYWGGLHTAAGLLVRQMRDLGVTAPLMGGDGIATEEFAAIGGPGVEGTLMTFNPDRRKDPAAAEVVKAFAAKNINPDTFTLNSNAAVQVIALSVVIAKSMDPVKVAEATKSGKAFQIVLGELTYNRKGDITPKGYVIYVWRKDPSGTIKYVEQ